MCREYIRWRDRERVAELLAPIQAELDRRRELERQRLDAVTIREVGELWNADASPRRHSKSGVSKLAEAALQAQRDAWNLRD